MTIPRYRVVLSALNASQALRAVVLFDGGAPEGVEIAYYLQRGDTIVRRSTYSASLEHSFALEEAGVYVVKAFVRLNDEKASRVSDELNVVLAEPEVPPLGYSPASEPFTDFVLVAVGPGQDQTRESLSKFASEIGGFSYREWQSNRGVVGVVEQVREGNSAKADYCFSGTARTDTEFVFGASDLSRVGPNAIDESVGEFVLARRTDDGFEVSADYFGVARAYYYESPEISFVSNSYHLLLLALRRAGVRTRVNRVVMRAVLQEASQPFQQNFTRSTGVKGCHVMMPGNKLVVRGTAVELRESAIASVLREPNDVVLSQDEYFAAVKDGAEEIVDNLRVALKHPRFDTVRIDVTGGMDSRTVAAALTRLPESRDRVHVHTAVTKSEPYELGIALELVRVSGFSWDTIPQERIVRDRAEEHRALLSEQLGAYFLVVSRGVQNRMPNTLRLNGFFGESCIRPYFSRSLIGTSMEGLEVSEFASKRVNFRRTVPMGTTDEMVALFRDEMQELPGDSTHSRYEAFYLFHRNAYHCSSYKTARTIGPSWGPLQSKKLFAIKWKTLSVKRDMSLQVDVIEALNYEMALIPASDDRVNRERAEIYPRYEPFVGAASRFLVSVEDEAAADYRAAARKRSEVSSWVGGEPDEASAESSSRYERDVEGWKVGALTELVDKHGVLSHSEAERLMAYMGTGNDRPGPGATAVRAQVTANKILSALYECRLAS